MNPRILLFGICLTLSAMAGCSTPPCHTVTESALKLREVSGSWIGFDEDRLFFYRVTLAGEGMGLCVVLYVDGSPSVYRISKWAPKNEGLTMHLLPVEKSFEPITISVSYADQCEMHILVVGVDRDWSHQALLYKEDDFVNRLRLSREVARKQKR